MKRVPADVPEAEPRHFEGASQHPGASAREIHWLPGSPMAAAMSIRDQPRNGGGKVMCFAPVAPRFPCLSLEFSFQPVRGDRYRFDLIVRAMGDLINRDAWQKSFCLWCRTYGMHPVFVRGNRRTQRTQARVVLGSASPVLDFFAQFAGIEGPHIASASDARIAQLDAQIALLRTQSAELAEIVQHLRGRAL